MIQTSEAQPLEKLKLPRVIKPPTELPADFDMPAVFLAGSIEQGTALDWQTELIESFKDKKIVFLNPRRDVWDSSLKQDRLEPQFRLQVLWELEGLEKADLIIMYFQPGTKSPVTLLEFGLFAKSNKMIVCCPDGFWRKGNVDIVCEKFDVQIANSVSELKEIINQTFPEI